MTFHGLEYDPVPVILSKQRPGRHALSEWVETSCVRAWEIRPKMKFVMFRFRHHLQPVFYLIYFTRRKNKSRINWINLKPEFSTKNLPTLSEFPQHMRNPETETMDWCVLCVLPCWIEVSGLTLMALPPPYLSICLRARPLEAELSCAEFFKLPGFAGSSNKTLGFQGRFM